MDNGKWFKQLSGFFIIVFVCIFFAGCGFNKNDETVTLRFSTWGSASELKILKPIIYEFEAENPDVKIELVHLPQDYFKKLHLLFASKLEPDVIFLNNLNLPVYKKFLIDLSEYVNKNEYFPQAVDALTCDSKLYAIPRDVSTLIIYYNKSIFKQRNVASPNRSWSIEDLTATARKLTKNGVWGISYEPQMYYALPYIRYFGGDILSSDFKNVSGRPETLRGIELYKNFAYKYHCAPMPSQVGSKTLAQMFLEGKIAMHLSGRWLVPKYRECAKFDWDIINFPNCASPTDASGWAVSKNSKHKAEAVKFVLFLSNKKNIEKMSADGLIVPARLDVAKSSKFLKGKPANSENFIYATKGSIITNVSKDYNKIVDKLNDAVFATP